MATLTGEVGRQNIVDRFADYVRDTGNAGISWGTNAYPFSEWTYGANFGGSTSGKPLGISGTNIGQGTNGEVIAQSIYDTLIAETNAYTSIRNIRAILFVDGAGGNNGSRPTAGSIYDQTAVAYMSSSYLQTVSAARDDVYSGNTVTSAGLEVMLSNMRSAYNTARSTSAGTFQTNVCHASCHSSCHSSRGRR